MEIRAVRTLFGRFLEAVVLVLMVALAVLVVMAVIFRKAGSSLVWYDEVASILLAWLTYYGAALAALHRAHIGFPGLVERLPVKLYRVSLVTREVLVLGFLALLAWAGWRVMTVLEGTMLVSLPEVSTSVAHSVIPLGAVLFMIAEMMSAAEVWQAPLKDAEEEP